VRTPENVYRKFVEFEERAAGIYLELASRFSKNPKLSSLWLDMATHEKQHAGLLQFCLRDGLFVPNLPDSTQIQKLSRFFKRLEKRAAEPKITVEQAFRLAIELETSEINTIYSYLTTTLHRSMYLLRRKIATSLPNHIDELLAMAANFRIGDNAAKELDRLKRQCSAQSRTHK
jgi:rubrerythrin